MRARSKLNDKSGICPAHLGNVINGTSRQCDCATLQGKYNKLTKANFLFRSVFLSDLLLLAKKLKSCNTKREHCISIANLVRITHEKYIKLEKLYPSIPEKCQH